MGTPRRIATSPEDQPWGTYSGVIPSMSQHNWHSRLAIAGWGTAVILGCVLWSGVVALRPGPLPVITKNEWQQGKANKDGADSRSAIQALSSEEYCKDGTNSKDCVVQLRTAEATESQAKYALFALLLALPTVVLSAFGLYLLKKTLDANRKAADEAANAATAASQANQLSRELFIATERPWVKVDVSIGGPLVYKVNGLNATLLFRVTNVGRSPAVNVWIDPRIYTFTGEATNPIALQQEHLTQIRARPRPNWGFMLFPGETKGQVYSLSISNEILEKAKRFASFVMPTVEGFVTYGFVFDRAVRVTSFSVYVQRKDMPRPATDKEARSTTAIFFDDGDMPAGHLSLVSAPMSEEYAD